MGRFRFRPLPRPRPTPPPRPIRWGRPPPPRARPPPPPPRKNPIDIYRKEIVNLKNDINKKNALITDLNYKITEFSKSNTFYKDKMYGKNKELGFLNILTKNSNKLENFNNINSIEEMTEGFTPAELKNLQNENILLEKQIQENNNNYSADDTQVFYKQQQFFRQKDLNFYLFIIFYTLILGLAIYLFLFNTTFNLYLKIFIIIILGIYPFIIEYIEFALYFISYYVYALVNGTTFDIDNYYGFTFTQSQ